MSAQSTSRYIHDMAHLVVRHLMPELIRFPRSHLERTIIADAFSGLRKGRPHYSHVLFVVDGTFVPVSPVDGGEKLTGYFSYKGSHSLNMQVFVGPKLEFLHVDISKPGAANDEHAFSSSSVVRDADTLVPPPFVGLGDGAYAPRPYILRPHIRDEGKGVDPVKVSYYNYVISSVRIRAEMAIGRFGRKFRRLFIGKYGALPIEQAQLFTLAAACLYNFVTLWEGSSAETGTISTSSEPGDAHTSDTTTGVIDENSPFPDFDRIREEYRSLRGLGSSEPNLARIPDEPLIGGLHMDLGVSPPADVFHDRTGLTLRRFVRDRLVERRAELFAATSILDGKFQVTSGILASEL